MPALLAALLLTAAPEQLLLARFCRPDACPTFAEAQDRARQLAREARARGEQRFAEIGACGDLLYVADDGPLGLKLYLFTDPATLWSVEFVGPYVNRQYGPPQRCLRRVTARLDEPQPADLEVLNRATRHVEPDGATWPSGPWRRRLDLAMSLGESHPQRKVELLENVACLSGDAIHSTPRNVGTLCGDGVPYEVVSEGKVVERCYNREDLEARDEARLLLQALGRKQAPDCSAVDKRIAIDDLRAARVKSLYLDAYVSRGEDPGKARKLFQQVIELGAPEDEYVRKARMRLDEMGAR